jgi:hypothetical protein
MDPIPLNKPQSRSKQTHKYKHRDRGTYWSDRRAGNAIIEGRIPYSDGKPRYLTLEEEDTLVHEIKNWNNPLTQPAVRDVANLVLFCYF